MISTPAIVAILGAGVVGMAVALSVASRSPEGSAATAGQSMSPRASDAESRVAEVDGRAARPAPVASLPALALKSRAALGGTGATLFSVPPPPKVQAQAMPAPEPAPVPPPLPFKYLGQMDEGGRAALFVRIGDRSLSLRVGDVVDGHYRLEAVKPGAAEFTFLPMAAKQTLTFGTGP